jgi:DNA-binding transcriptional regulator YiaG
LPDLERAGRKLQSARKAEQDAYKDAMLVALAAAGDGATEAEIARVLGVNRMTVRKWRGKR